MHIALRHFKFAHAEIKQPQEMICGLALDWKIKIFSWKYNALRDPEAAGETEQSGNRYTGKLAADEKNGSDLGWKTSEEVRE